jgi:hypothetical protein
VAGVESRVPVALFGMPAEYTHFAASLPRKEVEMRFAEMFKRPRRGAKVGHAADSEHHEDHGKSVQKEARKVWDLVGRIRHKNAKWE